MTKSLIIREEAEKELTEAFNWYEERVSGLGSEFLSCIDDACRSLLRNPKHYPFIHGIIRRAMVRRFQYEVFFFEENEKIIVIAVFHAKRNPERWQNRR